jgi:hypothetical protein
LVSAWHTKDTLGHFFQHSVLQLIVFSDSKQTECRWKVARHVFFIYSKRFLYSGDYFPCYPEHVGESEKELESKMAAMNSEITSTIKNTSSMFLILLTPKPYIVSQFVWLTTSNGPKKPQGWPWYIK